MKSTPKSQKIVSSRSPLFLKTCPRRNRLSPQRSHICSPNTYSKYTPCYTQFELCIHKSYLIWIGEVLVLCYSRTAESKFLSIAVSIECSLYRIIFLQFHKVNYCGNVFLFTNSHTLRESSAIAIVDIIINPRVPDKSMSTKNTMYVKDAITSNIPIGFGMYPDFKTV